MFWILGYRQIGGCEIAHERLNFFFVFILELNIAPSCANKKYSKLSCLDEQPLEKIRVCSNRLSLPLPSIGSFKLVVYQSWSSRSWPYSCHFCCYSPLLKGYVRYLSRLHRDTMISNDF